jgi:hypothetical protein
MRSLRVRLLELPRLAANATLMEEGVFARPKGVAKLWSSGLSDPGHASRIEPCAVPARVP